MTRICAAFVVGSLCLSIAACGGGGSSEPQAPSASIPYSADQLSFSTTGPWDSGATPASVDVIGTVQGSVTGTVYIIIQVNNPELVSAGNVIQTSPTSGQVTVTAANPAGLSFGRHTGSLV